MNLKNTPCKWAVTVQQINDSREQLVTSQICIITYSPSKFMMHKKGGKEDVNNDDLMRIWDWPFQETTKKKSNLCKVTESLWLWGWLGPEKVLCNKKILVLVVLQIFINEKS